MSVDIAWFPDYGHIVAGIFIYGCSKTPCSFGKTLWKLNIRKCIDMLNTIAYYFQRENAQQKVFFNVFIHINFY